MTKEQLREILKAYRLKPNFTYGQNFLINDLVLLDIVDAADVAKTDAVLEIGPGLGNLTQMLLGQAALVLSVEKDPKFLPVLKALKKEHKNFRYEIADALDFNFQKFFQEQGYKKYKVVANIPYYITGKILQMLLTAKFPPESVTILTQKEVAQNIVAPPGELGLLAISVQLYGRPELVKVVPRESFYPPPKVDSAVIHISLDKKSRYSIGDEKKFFTLLKACFSGKRKQLHNTLANNYHLTKEQSAEVLAAAKISPAARPQELSIDDWLRLYKKILEQK